MITVYLGHFIYRFKEGSNATLTDTTDMDNHVVTQLSSAQTSICNDSNDSIKELITLYRDSVRDAHKGLYGGLRYKAQ